MCTLSERSDNHSAHTHSLTHTAQSTCNSCVHCTHTITCAASNEHCTTWTAQHLTVNKCHQSAHKPVLAKDTAPFLFLQWLCQVDFYFDNFWYTHLTTDHCGRVTERAKLAPLPLQQFCWLLTSFRLSTSLKCFLAYTFLRVVSHSGLVFVKMGKCEGAYYCDAFAALTLSHQTCHRPIVWLQSCVL